MLVTIYILIALALMLNCYAIYMAAKRDDYTRLQKCVHIAVILYIPLLGAIGFIVFYRSLDVPVTKLKQEFGGGSSDSNYVSSSNINNGS